MSKINVKTASPWTIQSAMGESIKAQIKEIGSISEFIDRTGISRSSLYRLFRGDMTEIQTLIEVLQALQRVDILEQLVALPQPKDQAGKKSSLGQTKERASETNRSGNNLFSNASPEVKIILGKTI